MDTQKNKAVAAVCQEYLDKLHADHKGILAALIASADGFHLAAIQSVIGEERLAAMSSSMHALGTEIVNEAKLKKCYDVVIEAAEGKVLMLNVPFADEDLIMTVVANEAMVFGHLLFSCRQTAERISEKLAAMMRGS